MRWGKAELIVFVGLLLVGFSSPADPPVPPVDEVEPPAPDRLTRMWERVQVCELKSPEYLRLRSELDEMVSGIADSQRLGAAVMLMDRYASENVNAAAIGLFGDDPFSPEEIGEILANPKRTWKQRALLKAYFALVREQSGLPQLSEQTRSGLLRILTQRIEATFGRKIGYGEQRLLTHLSQSVLSAYAQRLDDVPAGKRLLEAMRGYVRSSERSDTFAGSVRGWLRLLENPSQPVSVSVAADLLGHWDPLVRLEAACFLGRRMDRRPEIVEQAWELLSDGRDEVRAGAGMAFAVGVAAKPDGISRKLVQMLTEDRGVLVQAAAAVAIAARGDEGGEIIPVLLERFRPRRNRARPGPKRTQSILSALAGLVGEASDAQRARMLDLAVEKLQNPPWGALALLKELGPEAASALPRIREYRSGAKRPQRVYIDRHVIPSIGLGIRPVGDKGSQPSP